MAIDYPRLKELFIIACDLDPAAQRDFLDSNCGEDEQLRGELLGLLKKDSAHEGVLADGVSALRLIGEDDPDDDQSLPARIGHYTPKRRIGSGGMGVVYLAQQDNPQRDVAIKVIRSVRFSRALLQRFETESRVLGRLQHPGIAQIVEAGMFDDGGGDRPFFAMEYVDGEPLSAFVASHDLSIRDRLGLFVQICDAVHHAHQRGVIHRDLKPANILVTATGQPKILDFGVARAIDSDVQLTTMHADAAQLVGTLPYMSPEQVAGRTIDIDTRSDVYALGVLLYELLTQRLPYDLSDTTIVHAARVICEREPAPLTTFNRTYRGDLNTIVLKALEKESDRRYQAASDLAADVQRFLRDEPILARPATATYQMRKFARRNRVLVAGTASVLFALMLGIVGTSMGMMTAQAREAEAQQQRDIAQAVNEFLNVDLLGSADPYRGKGSEVSVRMILDHASQAINEKFDDQPLVRASIRMTLGKAYRGLGLFDESEHHLREAVGTLTQATGPAADDTIAARNSLASTLLDAYRLDEAEPLIVETVELSEQGLGPNHEQTGTAYANHAVILKRRGRLDESERDYRRALEVYRITLGPMDRRSLVTMNNLGLVLSDQHRFDEAETLYRNLLAIRMRDSGPRHLDTAYVMNNLGHVLWERSSDTDDEVEQLWKDAYEIRRDQLGEDHADTLISVYALAVLANRRGNAVEAEHLQRSIIEIRLRNSPVDHYQVLLSRHALAGTLVKQDRLEEAEEIYLDVLEKRRRTLGERHGETRRSRNAVITVLRMRNNEAGVRGVMAEHLEGMRSLANAPEARATTVAEWAWLLLTIEPEDLRDPAMALIAAERAAEESERRDPDILDTLAVALAENGRVQEAIAAELEAIALVQDHGVDVRSTFERRLEEFKMRLR